ncbi:MAG: DNA topoisomerase III [Gammaproteobacteria bacterium]|nr:DNA topoisomerase III [Gammaproteobacteria bacterium]
MTRLFLCEKPSQGRDIARVLGASRRQDGCLTGDGVTVTWCFGHMLEMVPPDAYDPALKRWSLEQLPIIPEQWKLEPRKEARKQLNVVKKLLKQASSVVVATDADREGETIAREVLDACRWKGPVTRLWLSALDEASIRKALKMILPGEKTEPLYFAGLGRARADWLVGMNLTRAYTVTGRHSGYDGVRSVGRVQTPTLKLVVDRDREIENFKPVPYFELFATFDVANGRFRAKWLPTEELADGEGRCTNHQSALKVAQKIEGQTGRINKAETKRIKEPPPLPFDLSSLQQVASKRWGMGAQQVLDVAQALYETHKATSYPRTDCQYLPKDQFKEAPQVLGALRQSDPALTELIDGADTHLRSRVWNDKKITAHHAIVPTAAAVNVARMSQAESRLYDLIRRRYLAQFYPEHQYDKTVIEVGIEQETFRASGRTPVGLGWKRLLSAEPKDKKKEAETTLPAVRKDESAKATETSVESKQTKPPPRFTEGTLIQAMKSVGKSISDPALKKVLKETSGIGTEATRAGIIQTLFKRGFLDKEGRKNVISTPAGRDLIDTLPDPVKNPATTALWEQSLDDIAHGRAGLQEFVGRQAQWVRAMVDEAKQAAPESRPTQRETNQQPAPPCPTCAKPMRRRKGRNGFFWGCSGYPECKTTLPDVRGKPGKRKVRPSGSSPRKSAPRPGRTKAPADGYQAGASCPKCRNGKLVQRTIKQGRSAGKVFLGCTNYPRCDHFSWIK